MPFWNLDCGFVLNPMKLLGYVYSNTKGASFRFRFLKRTAVNVGRYSWSGQTEKWVNRLGATPELLRILSKALFSISTPYSCGIKTNFILPYLKSPSPMLGYLSKQVRNFIASLLS